MRPGATWQLAREMTQGVLDDAASPEAVLDAHDTARPFTSPNPDKGLQAETALQ